MKFAKLTFSSATSFFVLAAGLGSTSFFGAATASSFFLRLNETLFANEKNRSCKMLNLDQYWKLILSIVQKQGMTSILSNIRTPVIIVVVLSGAYIFIVSIALSLGELAVSS